METNYVNINIIYYPFGSSTNGRSFTSQSYRYGFNSQEKDDEINGSSNSYAFEYRIEDSRLGRFLSIDPLVAKFPYYTPYQFGSCNPLLAIDLEGLESSDDKNPTTNTAPTHKATTVDLPSTEDSPTPPSLKPKKIPNKWTVSEGDNLSTAKQQTTGPDLPSHPTLILALSGQTYYNTNVQHPFGNPFTGDNDITEGNHFTHIQRRIGETDQQLGFLLYKQKINSKPNGFGFEAPTQAEYSYSKYFSVVGDPKKNFNLSANASVSGGITFGVPRFTSGTATVNHPGGYRPIGVSGSLIVRVDATVLKHYTVFVATNFSHISTWGQGTSIGKQSGQSFDSIGLKFGFGFNVGK